MDSISTVTSIPKPLEDAFIKVSFEDDRESGDSDPMYGPWVDHASAKREATEVFSRNAFKKQYPDHSLLISQDYTLNLLSFPQAMATPLHPDEMVINTVFFPLARNSSPVPGILANNVYFGAFNYAWDKYDFILYVGRFFVPGQGQQLYHFILHRGAEQPARDLLLSAGLWNAQLHDDILVFNQGFWRKSHELWLEVQKANWADVILKQEFKEGLHKDIYGFFKSERVYKDLAIPWKRGIIMYGPPGNGKTISIKAIMKECSDKGFAPLYVKSFASYKGEEGAMEDVFQMGRQMSPCVIIFEDLDALINDRNRSFFLNQLDGFEGNDGLLCIGTTNHFEKLDPALSSRPSRFDRKYLFDDPDLEERTLYTQYWQKKLKKNEAIAFPDSLVSEVANMTDKFSFAYLKEAFVSTLVLLATQDEGDGGKRPDFETVLKDTIKQLRKQVDKSPHGDLRSWARLGLPAAPVQPSPSSAPLPPRIDVTDTLRERALAAAQMRRQFI